MLWLALLGATPWRALPAWTESLLPALGQAAVLGVLRYASGGTGAGFGAAAMLPIVWVALYGRPRHLVAVYAAVLAAAFLPIALRLPDPTFESRRAILWMATGAVIGPIVYGLVREVASRQHAELAAARVLSATLASIADPVIRYRAVRDGQGRVVDFAREWVNAPAAALLGRQALSLEDTRLTEVGGDTVDLVALLAAALGRHEPFRFEYPWAPGRGGPRWFEGCAVAVGDDRVLCTWRDVTERRAAMERLAHDAMHDQLTGLPNRRLLLDRLGAALRRRGGAAGVLFVDLDGFKSINDLWGHDTGDEVLVEIGRRLARALRGGDTVARIGGDEFVIVLPGLGADDAAEIAPVVQRIAHAIRRPVPTRKGEVTVGASIGHVIGRLGDDPEALIERADRAMYDAKATGRPALRLLER